MADKKKRDEKLLKKLKSFERSDAEMRHIHMDDVLLNELDKLGYTESVKYFNSVDKWYA